MEKLIELLNEYEKKTVVHWYEWYCQGNLMCRYIKDNFEFYTDEATTIAISKYYGFIKWLVDNDKIDRDKVLISFTMSESDGLGNYYGHGVENYQRMLMLLAISNTPIEDLISYLR